MYSTTTWKYLYSYLYLSAENVEEEWRDLWDSNPNLDLITILTIHTHTHAGGLKGPVCISQMLRPLKSPNHSHPPDEDGPRCDLSLFSAGCSTPDWEKNQLSRCCIRFFFTIPPSPTSVLQHREILKGKQNKHNDSDMHRIQLRWIKISHK